jgi:subtilisin family serine protease
MVLSKVNIKVNPLIEYKGEYLINRYPFIESFLEKQLNFAKEVKLAAVHNHGDYIAFSAPENSNYKSIDDFSVQDKEEIILNYNRIRFAILDYIDQQCISDPRLSEWKEILQEVFNPSNNVIYSDGKDILISWGCEFNNGKENYRERALKAEKNEQNQIETISYSVETDEKTKLPQSQITEKNEVLVSSNKKSSRGLFNRLGYGIIHFLTTGWWFILSIILLCWLFCFSSTKSTALSKCNAIEFLPINPNAPVPFDKNDIGFDDDSLFQIIENRVNVALKEDQEFFYNFIADLGENFISAGTEIIYYDEETARIQLSFDASNHRDIKQELRQAMSDYELLIWDERIFSLSSTFNDPLLEFEEWSWHLDELNMESVWPITTGDPNVVVAVVDDGFDLEHPELSDAKKTKAYNVNTKSNKVYGTSQNSHGTHVSTLAVGAANNNNGLAGIAPNAMLMPIQIGDGQSQMLSMTEIIDGILYALKNEADVINLSLAKSFSPYVASLPESQQENLIQTIGKDEEAFWKELFSIADEQNTTIVIAAGNEGLLSGIDPMQRHENCIVVGAMDKQHQLTAFSNFGKFNTVNAPGLQVVSAIPGNKYEPMDGTSMAAPIVTGAIALYKSLNPDASNSSIKNKIIATAGSQRRLNIVEFLKD